MISRNQSRNQRVCIICIYDNPTYTAYSSITEPVVKQSPRKRPRLCTLEDVRASPNETFLITIEYGEDEENFRESIFKVKGKHPVQKVLAMACHTLEVDKNDIPKYGACFLLE